MSEKRAPVQGYVQGIPWEMHLRAYNVYCKRYGPQQALIDLEGRNCRGGFGTGELDMFIPGWRDELEELPRLRAQLQSSAEEIGRLRAELDRLVEALTPSAYTKADYIGRFKFRSQLRADTDQSVPWTAVKEIMAAILDRAALQSLAAPTTEGST